MLRDKVNRSLRQNLALQFAAPDAALAPLAKALAERHGEIGRPRRTVRELAALVQRLRLARFEWDKVSTSDRLDIAWVLWDRPEPPAEHEAFLRDYLAWVDEPWRRIQACRVAAAWASAFDPRLPSIRTAGEWLAARAAQLLAPWPEMNEACDIFSWSSAPRNLAQAFLAGEETEAEFCDRLRLNGRLATGGLMLEALNAAAEEVEARLPKQPQLAARLLSFAMHADAFRPHAAAAVSGRARGVGIRLAEALLLPWQDAAPPHSVKRQIVAFLLKHYDDARTKSAVWLRMKPQAAELMRLWLKETTIDCFFKIAAQAKRDEPEQLRLRQRFWLSYLDHIDDALLIGGSQCIAALGIERLGHGRLVGARPDHGALLLKIGGMTVVETSHSSREHLWLPGNELAPRIHHRANEYYLPAGLSTGADFCSGYSCDEADEWQDRLHDFIARHTGIGVEGRAEAERDKVA
jgi:EH_Signature domain